jgi:hypothetical protein
MAMKLPMRYRLRQTVRQRGSMPIWEGYLWVQWEDPDEPGRWLPETMPEGARPSIMATSRNRCVRRLAHLWETDRRR